ncbi:MAG: nitrous oxide reductase family maturation protein NosD, partial [Ignavibacteriaceae bacterium]
MKYFSSKILLLLNFLLIISVGTHYPQIIADKNGEINTIKDAINIASIGDKVIIKPGVYKEGNIIINKRLTLIAEGNVVIDGEGKTEVLTISADSVNISGFTIINAGISYLQENAAIKLEEVKGCVIENNNLMNNFFGVYLAKSEGCIIRNNEIQSDGKAETSSGNGIHLWYCKNINIESNTISGHRDGIYLEFVENAVIRMNQSQNNLRYGLHFMFSDKCDYSNNIFRQNGAGVAVMYSKNVRMYDNNFNDNWGTASYGLLLKDISDSNIERNIFFGNTSGIYLEGCGKSIIQNNVFEKNGWAIRLMANSMDNRFIHNDFIANSFDIAINSRQN